MDRDVVTRLVYSMIQFLKSELERSGLSSLTEERAESVEVALQCLETAYGIAEVDEDISVSKPLYDIFLESVGAEIASQDPSRPRVQPSVADRDEAERLKNEGNQLMRDEKFDKALECYTKAIAKDKTNAVYFCNRAAAHSKMNNHLDAIEDCQKALRIEPQYSKAYGRMGLAYSALDSAQEAKECYEKALEVEPDNESYRGNLAIAEEKLRSQTQQPSSSAPNGANPFASLGSGLNLGALGNLAGLSSGSGSGQPDLQGLFNNPALMNMATQLMTDPNMQNMMTSFLGNITGSGPPQASTSSPTTESTEGGSTAPSTGSAPASGPMGMEALLSAGRHLAEQMQAQHPDLVSHIRNQMNRGSDGGNGNDQDPPQPPQS